MLFLLDYGRSDDYQLAIFHLLALVNIIQLSSFAGNKCDVIVLAYLDDEIDQILSSAYKKQRINFLFTDDR